MQQTYFPNVRSFHPGMGQAVAERTVLRKKPNGEWETWHDVASRVAMGNSLLCPKEDDRDREFRLLKNLDTPPLSSPIKTSSNNLSASNISPVIK